MGMRDELLYSPAAFAALVVVKVNGEAFAALGKAKHRTTT